MALLASTALQGGLKNPLLHGSDIPAKFDGIVCYVDKIRRAPANFKAPFIVDFKEPLPYGCKSWACNLTNAAILQEKIGDDLEALNGKRIYLKKVRVENPQSGETVWSLNVEKVEGENPPKVSKVDVKGKKAKHEKPAKEAEGVSEKDLPF